MFEIRVRRRIKDVVWWWELKSGDGVSKKVSKKINSKILSRELKVASTGGRLEIKDRPLENSSSTTSSFSKKGTLVFAPMFDTDENRIFNRMSPGRPVNSRPSRATAVGLRVRGWVFYVEAIVRKVFVPIAKHLVDG